MYTLDIYQCGFKPPWIFTIDTSGRKRFAHIQGMDGDQIAYAAQASEAAIIKAPDVQIEAQILRENVSHTDGYLYIAFNSESMQMLQHKLIVGDEHCVIKQIEVQFEVKHSYFNNLHKAVNFLPHEVIAKLVPEANDFKVVEKGRIPFPRHYEDILKLDETTPGEQVKALRVAAFAQSDAPPVLISGPFGTGKTRLLAAAAYFFIQDGKQNRRIARVLVCAHHQASADTFLECYFGLMKTNENRPWIVELTRLTSLNHRPQSQEFAEWYLNISELKDRRHAYQRQPRLLIITTCLTALNLCNVFPPGFFTHILLDEGAQAREPEAVAPLCLATQDTKIVIAGDPQQVSL